VICPTPMRMDLNTEGNQFWHRCGEIRSALDLLEAQEQFDPPDLSSRLKRIPGREGREFQISDIGAET
jgi:hypothetical protein